MNKCYKGEIYYIYKENVTGSEQEGCRPGIIVSNDVGNKHSPIVEVVYLTTRNKKPLPTHVDILSATYPSIALCEQVETVSKERIGAYINSVTDDEMKEIEKALLISFGINSNLKCFKKLKAWGELIEEWNKSDDIPDVLDEPDVPERTQEQIINPESPALSCSSPDVEDDPRFIKVCMERDVYKQLYKELYMDMIRASNKA